MVLKIWSILVRPVAYRLTRIITCYFETTFAAYDHMKKNYTPCVGREPYTNTFNRDIQMANTVPDYFNKTPDNKMSVCSFIERYQL